MAGTLLREAYKLKRVYGKKINENNQKTPEHKEYERLMKELKNASNSKRP